MLTKRRKEELAWLYLIYTLALQVPTYLTCSPQFLLSVGEVLTKENKRLWASVSNEERCKFLRDLLRQFKRIESTYKSHRVPKYELPTTKRHHLAYLVVVSLTRREYWWLGHYDSERLVQFMHSHNITEKETLSFFQTLIADVRKLGHVNQKQLRSTTT